MFLKVFRIKVVSYLIHKKFAIKGSATILNYVANLEQKGA
ncbi:hypothetical protein R078131_00490 [Convivina intestini]|nr:hypothetical protein R078131_00490 [Convivina intestini]